LGKPVIRIRDILENSVSNYSSERDIDDKYLINQGDILIGMDGNFHINYWSKKGCYLNQRVVKLSKTILPNIYLKYQVEPHIILREKSVSRTTVGHLSDKDLKAIKVILPSKEIIDQIGQTYSNFLKKIIINKNENQQLATLRDWLLPMLMNGQVTVGGVYAQTEDATEHLMVAEPKVTYGRKD
jgi:type I restriction enzyme S subunit